MTNKHNQITLNSQIKWVIGNRIMFCLGLVSTAVLIISVFDVMNGFSQVKTAINIESKNLSEFIIAQSLIENQAGITIKLNDLNENTRNKKFVWLPLFHTNETAEKIEWKFPFSWVYSYPVKDNDGKSYGVIRVFGSYFYDNSILLQLITRFSLLIFFSLIIFFLLYPLSNRIPRDLFIQPIMNLLILLKQRNNLMEKNNQTNLPKELQEVQTNILDLMNEITKHSHEIALGQIATQVAHDIRSPLTALDIVIKDIAVVPEEQRILIRNATNRIHDIANNLLAHQIKTPELKNQSYDQHPELIADLIASVISEKRVQAGNIQIIFNIHESAYNAFANLTASSFKRALSNLIDNGIEAIKVKDGHVQINLSSTNQDILIEIEDNGCGIESKLLSDILNGKIKTKKENGHGLGLSYAIKVFEKKFSGKFVITSKVGTGTKILIDLPKVSAPTWFAEELNFVNFDSIVIVDDDETIHQVWRKRFKNINANLTYHDFYDPIPLQEWYKTSLNIRALYLVDYEFAGSTENGLDLIEMLSLTPRSYLVTSRYEEIAIKQKCKRLGVKIIPKSFATHITFKLSHQIVEPELIFIDDDKTLTNAWALKAKMLGKNIAVFNSAEEFFLIANNYKFNIPIYIDSNLGVNVKGEDLAKELFNIGYQNLYLATGYHSFSQTFPWIKAVVGKEPPF